MANVVTPPRGFHQSLASHLAAGKSAATTGAGGGSKSGQNPLAAGALGDPSINQTFQGPFAGLAQFAQSQRQHKAFTDQQEAMSAALGRLQDKMQNSSSPLSDFGKYFTQNPKDWLLLHQSGVDPGQLLKTMMAGQSGQVQQLDVGGGNKLVLGVGQDGKSFHQLIKPDHDVNQALHPLGVDANGDVVAGNRQGETQTLSGVKNPSMLNNQNTQDNANVRADNRQDASNQRYAQAHPTDAAGQPIVKLTPAETNFYANSQQVYRALDDMQKIAPQVTGLISGGIATFVGGKMLGENPLAVRWNADLLSAQNGISQKDTTNYYTTTKEKLHNLPTSWLSPTQAIADIQQWKGDIQSQVQAHAGVKEAQGILPPAIAEAAANVGVYTKQFAPIVQKLRNNPDSLTADDLIALANGAGALSSADKAIAAKVAQRQTASQAQFAAPQPINPQQAPQGAPQQQQPAQRQMQLPPASAPIPQQPAGPGAQNPTRNFTPPASAPNTLTNETQPFLNPAQPGQPIAQSPDRSQLQQNQEDLQREIQASPNG